MKKLLALALAVLMITALSTTAFAADPVTNTGTAPTSITVNGTYEAGKIPEDVISVGITWGVMSFTYNTGTSGTWNPATHQYDNGIEPSWTASGNTITVTNHSNTLIDAAFEFAKASGLPETLTGSFSSNSDEWVTADNKLSMNSAEFTTVQEPPVADVVFTISGGYIDENTTLGTISVTITKGNASELG